MPSADDRLSLYADALLALGQAADALDTVEGQLGEIAELFRTHAGIKRFLADPHVRTDGKLNAIDELLNPDLHPVCRHFILMLQQTGSLRELPAVAEIFFERTAHLHDQTTGELVSAAPLTPERVRAVETEAGRLLGRPVSLRTRVDSNLLGGVCLRVGNVVLDGTVDHQLDQIRHRLLSETDDADGSPEPPSAAAEFP